jgi:hypothetical protein
MLSSITHRRVSRKRIQILGFLSQVYDKGNWYYFSWGWFESPTIDAYTSNCTLNLPPAWLHKRQSSRAARFHSHPMNPYLIISCLSHSCVRYRAECRGGSALIERAASDRLATATARGTPTASACSRAWSLYVNGPGVCTCAKIGTASRIGSV